MTGPARGGADWVRRARLFHHSFETPGSFEPTNVERFVSAVARAHGNVIRFPALHHHGYTLYQSSIAPKMAGLGDIDVLQQLIEAGARNGIRVVPDIELGFAAGPYHRRPEWASEDPHGNARTRMGLAWLCLNKPYGDVGLRLVEEIVSNYEIDGVYLGMPRFPVCYCQHCRARFLADRGRELPEEENWEGAAWRGFTHWRYEVAQAYFERAVDLVNSRKPRLAILANGGDLRQQTMRRIARDGIRMAKRVDGMAIDRVGTRLPYTELGWDAKLAIGFGARPLGLVFPAFSHRDLRHAVGSSLDLRLKLVSAIANGARPVIFRAETLIDDPERAAIVKELCGFLEREDHHFEGAEPLPYAAVLFSRQSADLYGGADPERRWERCVEGWLKALTRSRIPFRLIVDQDLAPERLARFSALCLPNAACLSDSQIQAVSGFVQRGGGLVATGATSLYDEAGRPRPAFGLQRVLQTRVRATGDRSEVEGLGYLGAAADHPLTDGGLSGGSRLPFRRYVPVRADGARVLARRIELLARPLGHDVIGRETEDPTVLAGAFGDGRVVYFPAFVDEMYREAGYPGLRRLIAGAVEWTASDPLPIELDAPRSVEVNVFTSRRGTIVHIANFTVDSQDPRDFPESAVCLRNVPVRLRLTDDRRVAAVTMLQTGRRLEPQVQGDYVSFTVPEVRDYAAIAIEFA